MLEEPLYGILNQIPGIDKISQSGDWHLSIPCLFGHRHKHGRDSSPSMTISFGPQKSWATCWGCGWKGPFVKALLEHNRISGGISKVVFLAQNIEDNSEAAESFDVRRRILEDADCTIGWQDMRELPWTDEARALLKKKGVSEEVAKKLSVCVVPADYHDPWMGEVSRTGDPRVTRFPAIVFPILNNKDGELKCVGAVARYLVENPKPKYFALYKFHATAHFFGEQLLSKAAGHPIVLVEGPLDAMHLLGFGIRTMGLLGTNLTEAKADIILAAKPGSIILALDPDEAGQLGADKASLLLKQRGVPVKQLQLEADPKHYSKQDFFKLINND